MSEKKSDMEVQGKSKSYSSSKLVPGSLHV